MYNMKPFHAMVKNSHTYTFNEEIETLGQTGGKSEIKLVKATTDYHLNVQEEPPEYDTPTTCLNTWSHGKRKAKKPKPKQYRILMIPESNNFTEILGRPCDMPPQSKYRSRHGM